MPAFLFLLLLLPLPQEKQTLAGAIEKRVQSAGLGESKVGITIHSLKEDKPLYRKSGDEEFLLASNTKLFPCAAALDLLGPDYEFTTELNREETTEGARLVVTGTGDPHISGRDFQDNPSALFERWAAVLKEKKMLSFPAGILLVIDKFETTGYQPGWSDYPKDAWWAAPFGQFSLNDNCVDVLYAPGAKEGDPVRLTLLPDTRFILLKNEARTVKGRGKLAFQGARKPGTNEIRFKGDLAVGNPQAKTWIAIQDPARYFGCVLKETLQRNGIEIGETLQIVDRAPEKLTRVTAHASKLDRIIQVCLSVSQNVYAEMLLHHLGWKTAGKGTRENGLRAIETFLEKTKLPVARLQDGSGLTRENRSSPDGVTALLRKMRTHKHARSFFEALAVNGAKEGTLRKRMKDAPLAGRIRGKTGHLNGVSTLSGYAEGKNGETYVFSILINGPAKFMDDADRLQDRICELLVTGP